MAVCLLHARFQCIVGGRAHWLALARTGNSVTPLHGISRSLAPVAQNHGDVAPVLMLRPERAAEAEQTVRSAGKWRHGMPFLRLKRVPPMPRRWRRRSRGSARSWKGSRKQQMPGDVLLQRGACFAQRFGRSSMEGYVTKCHANLPAPVLCAVSRILDGVCSAALNFWAQLAALRARKQLHLPLQGHTAPLRPQIQGTHAAASCFPDVLQGGHAPAQGTASEGADINTYIGCICCRDQELATLQKELTKRDKALKASEKALAAKEGRAAKAEERLRRREDAAKEREVWCLALHLAQQAFSTVEA